MWVEIVLEITRRQKIRRPKRGRGGRKGCGGGIPPRPSDKISEFSVRIFLKIGSDFVQGAEQDSEAFRETETPHILKAVREVESRTRLGHRTLFGTEKLQRIAISAVFLIRALEC